MPGQFKFLFSPLTIGKATVPNRISFSAHLTNFAENSLPSERHAFYYAARANRGIQVRSNPGIQKDYPSSP
jgi:2,4-dienoyl-CoA reductase (NADPH2)